MYVGSRDLGSICDLVELSDEECNNFSATEWEHQSVDYSVPGMGLLMKGNYCGYLEVFEGVEQIGCAAFNVEVVDSK